LKLLAIFTVSLLALTIIVPCLTVSAQPKLAPHEDPTAAKSIMDSFAFLSQYSQIFGLMAIRDYTNASRLNEELTHITVPAELSYVINRYNDLTQQLINTLKELQNTLDQVPTLLNQYRLTEAGKALDHAGVLVAQAQILLNEIQDATLSLSQRLSIFSTSVKSKVQQAYDQLQSMLLQLNDLINQYHKLLQEANLKAEDLKSQNLDATYLTLTLGKTTCFVGDQVSAYGLLSSEKEVMSNREVKLLIDNNQVETTYTNQDGTYSLKINIPYKFVDSVSLRALYTPEGSDRGVYLATLSPIVNLHVLFYKTSLSVTVPKSANPGLDLQIKGKVTSEDASPLKQRQINVLIDDVAFAQATSDINGQFSIKKTVNSQTKLGTHTLTVNVASFGLYSGVTIQRILKIEKIPTIVEIQAPTFIVVPSQLEVKGNVNSPSGPLKNTFVTIQLGNYSATVKTSNQGYFNYTIDMQLSSFLAGYQKLVISTQPTESWQAPTQTKTDIFVLSSFSIGIGVASSLSFFFVTYTKLTKEKNKKIQEAEFSDITKSSQISVDLISIETKKYPENKRELLEAYVKAVKKIQQATSEPFAPNMTLREFLKKTQPKLARFFEPFSELTLMAERSLYSPFVPQTEDNEKAKRLAVEIEEELYAGT
jgi:hypothetical protein